MFKKITLKNGLRVIIVPEKSTKAVTVLVMVGTGSKYETKETSGISHLLEHLLFKGTKKRPNHLAISEPLDGVGGIYNAFTSEEYTGYYAKVASAHFDLALDVISDIYLNSKLPPKEIAREKGVIAEEINMYYDHPMSYINTLWHKVLYGDQPAGWDIAGTKESVFSIQRESLNKYRDSQYSAKNTIVCCAGNVGKISQALSKVMKYFSGISEKDHILKPKVIERQSGPGCLLHYKKTDQTHLALGARAYNLFQPEKYAQEILAQILGGMMSSRLFVRVRERSGLAYYVRTESSCDTDTGYLVSQAGVDNKRVEKAIFLIMKEYKKIASQRVPPNELKKAKDHIRGKMALTLESSDSKASFYGSQELLERKILTPEEIYDKIDKVGAEDVLRVADSIFRESKLNLVLVGPWKNKEKFQKLLKI